MKKCYIAGKIGNLPEVEYRANFSIAKQEVAQMGYEPVSPVDLPHNHGKTYGEYMKEDIRALMECDAVYALTNWRHSPGATVEIELAAYVGINIIHQQ